MLVDETCHQTVEAYIRNNCSIRATAKELGVTRTTVRNRLAKARKQGLLPKQEQTCSTVPVEDKIRLEAYVAELKKELKATHRHNLDAEEIKKFVYGVKNTGIEIPEWTFDFSKTTCTTTGVPCLCLSDLHFSEVVDPSQVLFRNKYNIEIATQRFYKIIERSIDLLRNHLANPNYPGIVVKLLGDMFSGNIHDELRTSNELSIFQAFHLLFEIKKNAILTLANEFNKVFIIVVPGNHSRNTPKIQAKSFAYENFDWHLGVMLQKFFENDERVKFLISDGYDIQYRIYNWTFRATHGAQFKGGDGIIGPLGPIFRGDIRKHAQARAMDTEYDFLVLGHFHRQMMLSNIIVNGSIKGFDEYAFKENLPFEEPRQALWIMHPERGMTFKMDVYPEDPIKLVNRDNWVSWIK
jgi:transposase-like protein